MEALSQAESPWTDSAVLSDLADHPDKSVRSRRLVRSIALNSRLRYQHGIGGDVTCPLCDKAGQEPGAFCTSCGMRLLDTATAPSAPVDTTLSVTPQDGNGHLRSVHHIHDGEVLLIPEDVPHGLYRASGWFVLRDAAGNEIEQGAADPSDGVFALLLADGRSTTVSTHIGDGTLTPLELMPVIDVLAEGHEEGYCIVGADLQPGSYWLEDIPMAKSGTFHYWARLDDQLNVIDNEYLENSGGVRVEVDSDDFAFVFTGALRPMESSPTSGTPAEGEPLDFRYAEASASASLTGLLFVGSQGLGAASLAGMSTHWLSQLDEGVTGRTPQADTKVFGSFVQGRTTVAKTWTVLSVITPLGNRGLVVLCQASGDMARGVSLGTRFLVPIVVDADATTHDPDQLRATVDWMLAKVSSPYMAYVPLVESDSDRLAAIKALMAQAGTPVGGPLTDPEWLADPMILATMSNPAGFPGPGSQRLGVLQPRSPGRVDIYAGWQVDLTSSGIGLSVFGHRSILALIDAVHEIPGLRRELGSGTPPLTAADLSGLKALPAKTASRPADATSAALAESSRSSPPPEAQIADEGEIQSASAAEAEAPRKKWWRRS